MIPTKATMQKINEVNDLLIKSKYILLEAEKQAVDLRERTDIKAVSVHIQAGIKEILRTFYPDVKEALAREAKEKKLDAEHDQRVQKILDNSAQRQAESEKTCSHDCNSCDSREVVGDDEHCLQGEEMK